MSQAITAIQRDASLPGSPPPTTVVKSRKALTIEADDDWKSDPNKGRFGGSPVNNGRKLSAMIGPAAGPLMQNVV